MMQVLIEAAEAARKVSNNDQFVEIVVTEEGFIVRGQRGNIPGKLGVARAVCDIRWPEFEGNSALLANAVYLVEANLRAEG